VAEPENWAGQFTAPVKRQPANGKVEVVRQLTTLGIPPGNVYVYERFQNQMDQCNYAAHLPEGIHSVAAETANRHADNAGYDPFTYIEATSLARTTRGPT